MQPNPSEFCVRAWGVGEKKKKRALRQRKMNVEIRKAGDDRREREKKEIQTKCKKQTRLACAERAQCLFVCFQKTKKKRKKKRKTKLLLPSCFYDHLPNRAPISRN